MPFSIATQSVKRIQIHQGLSQTERQLLPSHRAYFSKLFKDNYLPFWCYWHTRCSYAHRKLETLSVFSRSHRTQCRMIRACNVDAIFLQHSGQYAGKVDCHLACATLTESEPSLRLLALTYGGSLSFYRLIFSTPSMSGRSASGITIEPSDC